MKDLTAKPNQKTAVALGYFDGVHLGHRRVLQGALDAAAANDWASGAFTFYFDGANPIKGSSILSLEERRRRMETMGINYYYCPGYESFRDLSPEAFVQQVLIEKMNAAAVFTGDNFTFGKGGVGNVELLGELCRANGITHTLVDMQAEDGTLVSSTRIRGLLEAGEIAHANLLLGAPYAVTLPVQPGKQLGGRLGFPTINQRYPAGMLMPKQGVYISRAEIDGVLYAAATGLGSRPTVEGEDITCESFLIDYTGDLYGKSVRLELHQYLEPTRKYESLEELRLCIARAVTAARQYFA